ncbi:dipeptidase [Caldibacillus lycopersici]|uniref:Dipeptidase n=1 Tax=Perspicuibacillus lycopersici TaxID=1325689 RepID=A0AAE3IUI4_9BACI|nr:dipeptidase [Perspicuibacillus lycopersici]MCU9614677.1 dipeptidase [Perspicuibacillus lycopersici]
MGQAFQDYLQKNRENHLQQLVELLQIPSISALSEHKDDVRHAASWLANELQRIGIENVAVMETKGHPVVYGDWLHAEGKPTVLVYGHYDVQPVDPLNLWDTPPFEPTIKDEKIYARGSSDDKGQVFMHIKAIEALFQTNGSLPVNVKFIFEGEEEVGSPNLPLFIEENHDLLKADLLVISDTGMMDKGKPTICYGLRGLTGLQIDIQGANSDLHSGAYGGGVQNPAHALIEVLASFHDKHGKILVDGFYENVRAITDEEKKAFADLHTDEEAIRKELGVPELFGEEGFTFNERTWVRPTLEINGVYSGFQGEGIKTVLPNKATAKITCRLVPDQDPEEIYEKLVKHIENNKPKGVNVTITPFDKGAPFITPLDHPAIQVAGKAYEKVYGVPVSYTRSGGSIPIVATFHELLNTPVVLMGFALPNENVHAPNEHFHLENFDKGMLTLCHYWLDLANSL